MPTGRLNMRRIRDVLQLKFGQGMSERDIAVSLGLSKGSVGLICILEPAPPADVIDEDHLKIGGAILYMLDQLLHGLAALDPEAAFPGISIGAHQFESTFGGILADRV